MTPILAALALFAAASAPALPPGAAFYSAAEVPATVGKPMSEGPNHNHAAYVRTADGEVEIHRDWNDTFLVQEGRAVVMLGGRADGGREIGPGELRGGTQTGAAPRALAPGDILFVPAGMPHLVLLGPGAPPFRYLVFKSRR